MSFFLSSMSVGLTPPIEHMKAAEGETVKLGEALTLDAGALTKCGATVKPSYIAVGPADMHGMTPVIAVQAYMVFETTLSAAAGEGGLRAGSKVTLSADGLQVTATTASGVAEIVSIDGGAVGDTVLVKF